jgi:hypothetical protein
MPLVLDEQDWRGNEAPRIIGKALTAADVGIAMGSGTDVAIESAGVTLLKGDLTGIVRARRLSQAVMGNIRQNLFFAFIYSALGVPVAAGVLYPVFGILLSPVIASAHGPPLTRHGNGFDVLGAERSAQSGLGHMPSFAVYGFL